MKYYVAGIPFSDELYHHGIKGQKWGIRRYQNPDGSLTPEGKAKYGTIDNFNKKYKSAQRGAELVEQGRTKSGIIGRGIARQAAITVGAGIVKSLLQKNAFDCGFNEMSSGLLTAGSLAVSALGLAATAHNVYKTSRQFADIKNAEKFGVKRDKTRKDNGRFNRRKLPKRIDFEIIG